MANLATYGGNSLLNGTAMPATLYVKLHLGAPGLAGTGSPAVNATRQSFTRGTATSMTNSNVADLLWTSVSTTEVYTHVSIWDSSTAGNCWWQGPLATTRSVQALDDFKIAAGDLDLSLS